MTDNAHDWSPQQVAALKAVEEWFAAGDSSPQIFRLFGYAGTGKTTLAREIEQRIDKMALKEVEPGNRSVLYAAFTGKAALVLRSKGCAGASTIHSLIYSSDENEGGPPGFTLNPASKLATADLLIVDECSMVGAELATDMLSFGVKILVLGDPAQLPPVGDGAGYFTEVTPDVMLSEVHRQAEGNPIIRLSMDIRNGVKLVHGDYGACKIVPWVRDCLTTQNILAADQLLVGRNATRERMNDRYRVLANFKAKLPMLGDKMVCLKNDRIKNLFNGGLWKVVKLGKYKADVLDFMIAPEDSTDISRTVKVKVHPLRVTGPDEDYKALPWEERKGKQEFTFGYALTVHKAQGSQWGNVILFNEAGVFGQDAQRWLYTGVTRAAETLTVVQA